MKKLYAFSFSLCLLFTSAAQQNPFSGLVRPAAYVQTVSNVSPFSEKGSCSMYGFAGLNHLELQSTVALTGHIAVQYNLYVGHLNYQHEGAASYSITRKNLRYTGTAGFSYSYMNYEGTVYDTRRHRLEEHARDYHISRNQYKYFAQAGITFLASKNRFITLAAKFNYLHFENYYYRLTHFGTVPGKGDYSTDIVVNSTRKDEYVMEPSLSFIKRKRIFTYYVQLLGCFALSEDAITGDMTFCRPTPILATGIGFHLNYLSAAKGPGKINS